MLFDNLFFMPGLAFFKRGLTFFSKGVWQPCGCQYSYPQRQKLHYRWHQRRTTIALL